MSIDRSEFTDRAIACIKAAKENATSNSCNYIGVEHLLAGILLVSPNAVRLFIETHNLKE